MSHTSPDVRLAEGQSAEDPGLTAAQIQELNLGNRPEAVLQTPPSLVKLVSHPFPPYLQIIITLKLLELGS